MISGQWFHSTSYEKPVCLLGTDGSPQKWISSSLNLISNMILLYIIHFNVQIQLNWLFALFLYISRWYMMK